MQTGDSYVMSDDQYLSIEAVIEYLAIRINTAVNYGSGLISISDDVAVSAVRRLEHLQAEVEQLTKLRADAEQYQEWASPQLVRLGELFVENAALKSDNDRLKEESVSWRRVAGTIDRKRDALMSREVGWLVEDGDNAVTMYRTMDEAGIHWTDDVNKAIRFARRADAEMFAAGDENAWRIVEHVWVKSQPTEVKS